MFARIQKLIKLHAQRHINTSDFNFVLSNAPLFILSLCLFFLLILKSQCAASHEDFGKMSLFFFFAKWSLLSLTLSVQNKSAVTNHEGNCVIENICHMLDSICSPAMFVFWFAPSCSSSNQQPSLQEVSRSLLTDTHRTVSRLHSEPFMVC